MYVVAAPRRSNTARTELIRKTNVLRKPVRAAGTLQLLFDVRFLRDVLAGGRPLSLGAEPTRCATSVQNVRWVCALRHSAYSFVVTSWVRVRRHLDCIMNAQRAAYCTPGLDYLEPRFTRNAG
jgi:hypothetical protein